MSTETITTVRRETCAVAIMAKASEPGRTKTRLTPPLTSAEAAALNTAFLQDMAAKLECAGEEVAIAPCVAYGPLGSEPFFRSFFPTGFEMMEVWRPNFGECLWLATNSMVEAGHASACVLNSDSPTLPAAYLIEAAQWLARPGDRAVLGPSMDGGYYLLGLKQAHRRMFADIAWSTELVAEQTRARAGEIGLEVHELPTWYDVDDADALRTLIADLQLGPARTAANPAASRADATADLLLRLDRDGGLFRRLGIHALASSAGSKGALV